MCFSLTGEYEPHHVGTCLTNSSPPPPVLIEKRVKTAERAPQQNSVAALS